MVNIERFSYIWTTEKEHWQVKDLGDGDRLIFNKTDKTALSIDDEDIYLAVIEKMLEEGVEVSKM